MLLCDDFKKSFNDIWQSSLTEEKTDYSFVKSDLGLEQLCSQLIAEYLFKNNLKVDQSTTHHQLCTTLNVISEYQPFIEYMLNYLASNDYLIQKEHSFFITKKLISLSSTSSFKKIEATTHTSYKNIAKLVTHCITSYEAVLSGQMPYTQVLFPRGNINFISQNLAEFHKIQQRLPIYFDRLVVLLEHLTKDNEYLNILEIGAGTGIMTWPVLNGLASQIKEQNFSYYITDISRTFLAKAKKQALNLEVSEHLEFKILNMNYEPIKQDFKLNSMDIILIFDALHVAKDISKTLEYFRLLLKKQGVLIFLETTTLPSWQHFIWGLTPEWWQHEQNKHGPLINKARWKNALDQSKFSDVCIFNGPKNTHCDILLFYCQT